METIIKKNGTKVFRERIYINGNDIKSPCFQRITDAKSWKARKISERDKTLATGLNYKPSIEFMEFAYNWLNSEVLHKNATRTYEAYKSAIELYFKPVLDGVPLGQVNCEHANKIISILKNKDRKNKTINFKIFLLKSILNYAVKLDYIPKNPLQGQKKLKEENKQMLYWSKTEISQFLRANLDNKYYPVYVLVLNTGLRLGEALGLCWDRVNIAQSQIDITRTLSRHGLKETTKTNYSRVIPINDAVKDVLLKLFRKQNSKKFVFAGDDGSIPDYEHLNTRDFKKAQLRAGFTYKIRFHDLRHTFASQFMMSGGEIFTLQKLLGHKNIDMTMRYAHLSGTYLKEASKIVSFSAYENGFSPNSAHENFKIG